MLFMLVNKLTELTVIQKQFQLSGGALKWCRIFSLCGACNRGADTDPNMIAAVGPWKVRHPLSEPSCSSGWWERAALMMGCDSRSLSKAEVSTHIFVPVRLIRMQPHCTSSQPGLGCCFCAWSYLRPFVFTSNQMLGRLNDLDVHIMHNNTSIIMTDGTLLGNWITDWKHL